MIHFHNGWFITAIWSPEMKRPKKVKKSKRRYGRGKPKGKPPKALRRRKSSHGKRFIGAM